MAFSLSPRSSSTTTCTAALRTSALGSVLAMAVKQEVTCGDRARGLSGDAGGPGRAASHSGGDLPWGGLGLEDEDGSPAPSLG